MDHVLELSGLRKSFGEVRALNGLDLRVRRGEVHGFLGRGCPEFRRTSVAARCESGCDDLLIMHGGCDSSGDLGVERGAEFRQV